MKKEEYRRKIICLLRKVRTEDTLERVYKLLKYLYIRED